MTPLFLSLPIILSATMPAQTPPPEAPPPASAAAFPVSEDTVWRLTELDGTSVDGEATLVFFEEGRIAGKSFCNNYNGGLEGTPESFAVGLLATTQMACPDMEPEQRFLAHLEAMTSAEITETTLTLTGPDGQSMTFARSEEDQPAE